VVAVTALASWPAPAETKGQPRRSALDHPNARA
jgi:hypothetical protein